MSVDTKTVFVCLACGSQHPKWQGQCRDCGQWNVIVEETISKKQVLRSSSFAPPPADPILLSDIDQQLSVRFSTGSVEFDHVLGGGVVSDSVILIGGDPGIGKSTLLLQILCQMSESRPVCYVTGEESLQQVSARARRLGLHHHHLHLIAEMQVERIMLLAQQLKPQVMVIDSVQTVYAESISSAPGGVSQLRESSAQLVRFAKQYGMVLFLVGHVTKEGVLAGPRILEHMVDTVLYFEGGSDSRFRMIRAVKNRFGAVNEMGIFAMTDKGLKQVTNPSAIFLSRYDQPTSGSVVTVSWEGSRPILVEIQALVDDSHLANPRRVTLGLEHNRLSMLLAVLHRHTGIATYNKDVFVNVVGGLRILETGVDLPLILAVLSSLRHKALPIDLIAFGEIGLAGEIRPIPNGQARIKEAKKHGFMRALVPKANVSKTSIAAFKAMEIIAVERIQDIDWDRFFRGNP